MLCLTHDQYLEFSVAPPSVTCCGASSSNQLLYDGANGTSTVQGTPAGTHPEEYPLWFLIIFATITMLGMLGNLLVMVLISALPNLRTTPNIFVFNLCLADFLLGFTALFAFVDEIDAEWVLDAGACRLFGFLSFMPLIAVVLSMVVVAKIRHQAITSVRVSGSHGVTGRGRVVLYLVFIWSISALLALPILLGWVSVRAGLFCACCVHFRENLVYGITVTVVAYIIPNILIIYYYIRIFVYVRRSRLRVEQHSGPATSQSTARKSDIRLARQFIVLFLIFNLCYMPTMIVFWVEDEDNPLPTAVHSVVMIIFALNIILNPLAYFAFNKGARRELSKCCTRKKNTDESAADHAGPRVTPSPQRNSTRIITAHARARIDVTAENHARTLDSGESDRPVFIKESAHDNSWSQSTSTSTQEDAIFQQQGRSRGVRQLLVRTTEASGYLLIGGEGPQASDDLSSSEHCVNSDDKKPSADKECRGTAPAKPRVTFFHARSHHLTLPETERPARGSLGQNGPESLKLERLSVVSAAARSEDERIAGQVAQTGVIVYSGADKILDKPVTKPSTSQDQ